MEILPHARRLDPKKVQKRKKNKILFNFLRLSRFSSKRILLPRTLYPGGKPKNQKDSHLISVLRAITGPNPPRPKHNMISNSSSGDFFSPLLDCCYRRSGPQSHNFVWGRREEKAISLSLLLSWYGRGESLLFVFPFFPFFCPAGNLVLWCSVHNSQRPAGTVGVGRGRGPISLGPNINPNKEERRGKRKWKPSNISVVSWSQLFCSSRRYT